MLVYIILKHCSVIGTFSCITDAASTSKLLAGSTIVQVHLTSLSTTGKTLVSTLLPLDGI